MNVNSDSPTPVLPAQPTACRECGAPLDHLTYGVWAFCSRACAQARHGSDA